ncbi:MAG: four helix bundle suffix domain-containing protein [Chlamydiales bacterium]|nr:four helix bundle suffix domain-containing protein [Chlamydiales bacterium]
MNKNDLIVPHGGYRSLKSYQVALLVYDSTVRFCRRFVSQFSRTNDQMVQAARSGVQNIAEGSQASGTSKKTELKLTNVARASLEELLLDYEGFLRQKGLSLWDKTDSKRKELVVLRCSTADELAHWVKATHEKTQLPIEEIAANAIHALIGVACFLLRRQIMSLAEAFVTEGGFTERLYQKRKEAR